MFVCPLWHSLRSFCLGGFHKFLFIQHYCAFILYFFSQIKNTFFQRIYKYTFENILLTQNNFFHWNYDYYFNFSFTQNNLFHSHYNYYFNFFLLTFTLRKLSNLKYQCKSEINIKMCKSSRKWCHKKCANEFARDFWFHAM
jgi:hypothetical protein